MPRKMTFMEVLQEVLGDDFPDVEARVKAVAPPDQWKNMTENQGSAPDVGTAGWEAFKKDALDWIKRMAPPPG